MDSSKSLLLPPHLPIIDFSDTTLEPGSSKWVKVRSDVLKALQDYGCFEASFDKVTIELKSSVLESMEELFDLPIQTKQRNVSTKPYHGYICHNLYESLGIDDANVFEKVNDFTQQIWPGHGNISVSETIHKFSKQLSELDAIVRRMIMEIYGIDEKYIDEHLNSTNYLLLLMKYTPPPLDDDDDEETTKIGLKSQYRQEHHHNTYSIPS